MEFAFYKVPRFIVGIKQNVAKYMNDVDHVMFLAISVDFFAQVSESIISKPKSAFEVENKQTSTSLCTRGSIVGLSSFFNPTMT